MVNVTITAYWTAFFSEPFSYIARSEIKRDPPPPKKPSIILGLRERSAGILSSLVVYLFPIEYRRGDISLLEVKVHLDQKLFFFKCKLITHCSHIRTLEGVFVCV